MTFSITQKPSPNYFVNRENQTPLAVVLHVMAGTLSGTDSWFSSPQSQASAHYGIGFDGTIHQYVQEKDMAWANGTIHRPSWKLLKGFSVNPNAYTISIEHEGQDLSNAPLGQLESSVELIWEICNRWGIPKDRDHIIGHYELDSIRRPNCPSLNKTILERIVAMVKAKG